MWHKPEVYVTIRHPFGLAWREYVQRHGGTEKYKSCEHAWEVNEVSIADAVVNQATIPSQFSNEAMIQRAMYPWKEVHYTRDDGVANMSIEQVKRICLEWLEKNL